MGLVTGRGINQGDLVSLLTLLRTNFLGVCAKLDAENLGDSDYVSTLTFTFPTSISNTGIANQGSVIAYLQTLRTKLHALFAKLDLDGTVTATDFAGQFNLADRIDVNSANRTLYQAGVYEGSLVKWIEDYLNSWNLALAYLDADDGVTGTNYAALWGITASSYLDTSGTFYKPN